MILQKASEVSSWELVEETEKLWTTYQQMLQFMLQGINDVQSERIRTDICHQLSLVASRLERLERIKNHGEEKYVSVCKEMKRIPSFESIVSQLETVSQEMTEVTHDELLRDSIRQHRMETLLEEHEATMLNLFNWTWTSEVWQNADVDLANRIILSDRINANDKAVFITAITLSIFEFVDTAKLLFLLDCNLVEDDMVSQRALVGFLLVFHFSFTQVKDHQDLKDRLQIYSDDATFIHDLYATMMQLQMSCTTESVTSRMRNDIMPALMQGLTMGKKTDVQNIDPDAFIKNGENPEWMDNEKMNKKMQEMAEMQLDGADVYFASFSTLKGYSFFHQMPHWFYPFSLESSNTPELKKFSDGMVNKIIRLILKGSPFCNSDKYSLCFTFSNLGGMAESAVEAQINSQLPRGMDVDELADSAELHQPKKADIRRHYVFDLYRFYNIYPYKQQFTNPFALLKEHPVTPYSNPWLQELMTNDKEEMAQYADFLMRKEFYQAALDLFTTIASNEFDIELASIWQKIGFCHQKLNHTEDTIHAYTVANSIKPNSKWTLSHLASLYYNSGRMEDASKYYQELLEINPESLKYLMNSAQSLMQCGHYEEALPLLYKASFLDEESPLVKMQLAWCLIVNGKKEEATKFVFELQTEDTTREEAAILLGIVMLLDGKVKEAYEQLSPLINDSNKADTMQKLDTLCRQKLLQRTTLTLFTDALVLHIR
jgi:tetratricopeptide (TPR) repeat protein